MPAVDHRALLLALVLAGIAYAPAARAASVGAGLQVSVQLATLAKSVDYRKACDGPALRSTAVELQCPSARDAARGLATVSF